MMTKKRTSALANMKLVLAVPVAVIVFFAISAYREIPDSPDQKSVPETAYQTLPNPSSTPSSATNEVSKSSAETVAKKPATIEINREITPPPPPPPLNDQKMNSPSEEEAPFVVVEEMPMFPGGDAELLKYIGHNTRYPEAAKLDDIQGRVIIRFCVTASGSISQISVLKGVSPELDAEAMRVVNTLPTFQPGREGGKAVPVWYMIPITFTLK